MVFGFEFILISLVIVLKTLFMELIEANRINEGQDKRINCKYAITTILQIVNMLQIYYYFDISVNNPFVIAFIYRPNNYKLFLCVCFNISNRSSRLKINRKACF